MALEGIDRFCDVLRRGEVTDAPARHGVRLGNAVDGNRQILHLLGTSRNREGLHTVIAELFVNLVGKDEDFSLLADLCNRAHLLFRIHRTRGIGRGIEDEHFRFRRNRGFELFGGKLKLLLFLALYVYGHAAANLHHFGIGQPIGSGNDDLVALLQNCKTGVKNGMLCAVRNNDLRGLVRKAVIFEKFVANCLSQRREPRRGGILRVALVERGLRCVDDVTGGVEIGLSHAERNDGFARRLHRLRLRRNGQGQ